ncbi:hypothetical protein C8Q75DRAFT_288459 [Abortiporus biennis]|nr:hypothetical protein C8Q75DRAFT_288459 [Abortiporus biennis]
MCPYYLEDNKDFAEAYPLLVKLLSLSLHVAFTLDPLSPCRAPITEFVYASVNAELSATMDIQEVNAPLQTIVDRRLSTRHGAALGRMVENGDLTVGTLGWDQVQKHVDGLQSTQKVLR